MIGHCALLLLGVAIMDGGQPTVPHNGAIAALLLMALGGTVLAYLFWNTGIAELGAERTALFLNLVPVFAMLAGTLAGTSPTHVQLIGALLVIGGVTIAMIPRRRPVVATR